jgi:hypothetical protein
MPDTDIAAARAVIERLRDAVKKLPMANQAASRDGSAQVTRSAGLASARDGEISIEEVIRRADLALYRAKETGRDRIEIRYVAGADLESRSLTCIASLPQDGMTMFMNGDSDSVLGATETACREACDGLGGIAPIGMLLFDCVARRSVLESASAVGEFDCVEELMGQLPVAGFYTYGEIARTQGAGGFHNQTLVALALS